MSAMLLAVGIADNVAGQRRSGGGATLSVRRNTKVNLRAGQMRAGRGPNGARRCSEGLAVQPVRSAIGVCTTCAGRNLLPQ